MGQTFAEGGSGGFDPNQVVPGTGKTVDELQRTGDYSRSDLAKMGAKTTMGPKAVGALGGLAGSIGNALASGGGQQQPAGPPVQFQVPSTAQFQAPDTKYLNPTMSGMRAFFGG